jgi:Mycoplasma protein of unknown function, DUF285
MLELPLPALGCCFMRTTRPLFVVILIGILDPVQRRGSMKFMTWNSGLALAVCSIFIVSGCHESVNSSPDSGAGTDTDSKPPDTTFVSSWTTDKFGDSDDNQITLPLVSNGSYNFIVNWGDGSEDTITQWDSVAKTHTYSNAGTYEVTITGQISGWAFGDDGDGEKIVEISNWGCLGFGDTSGHFFGCRNLTVRASDVPDLLETTSLEHSYRRCRSLAKVPSMNSWDTSSITNMASMFEEASTFNLESPKPSNELS